MKDQKLTIITSLCLFQLNSVKLITNEISLNYRQQRRFRKRGCTERTVVFPQGTIKMGILEGVTLSCQRDFSAPSSEPDTYLLLLEESDQYPKLFVFLTSLLRLTSEISVHCAECAISQRRSARCVGHNPQIVDGKNTPQFLLIWFFCIYIVSHSYLESFQSTLPFKPFVIQTQNGESRTVTFLAKITFSFQDANPFHHRGYYLVDDIFVKKQNTRT